MLYVCEFARHLTSICSNITLDVLLRFKYPGVLSLWFHYMPIRVLPGRPRVSVMSMSADLTG